MSQYKKLRVCVLSTGGTIEKVYDEITGVLTNQVSRLPFIIGKLVLQGVDVESRQLMNKDSLEMDDADRALVVAEVEDLAARFDALVVVHGTDRLARTGETLHEKLGTPRVPVVLTGAMRPFELFNTDAMQNLTESLLAVQLVEPGIYVCMHNRVIEIPGAVKDHQSRTFVRADELMSGSSGT